MKVLDFATSDERSGMRTITAFLKTDQFRIRRVLQAMREGEEALAGALIPGAKLDGDTVVFYPRWRGVVLRVWLQGEYYIMSFDLSQTKEPTWECLQAMIQVAKSLGRRDLPVKVDKGDTITIKAAIAVAALEIAQGVGEGGCAGILWDMARDRLI